MKYCINDQEVTKDEWDRRLHETLFQIKVYKDEITQMKTRIDALKNAFIFRVVENAN